MIKVLLMVVIVFNNKPSVTYKVVMKDTADCYTHALELSKSPPIDDDVTKFLIGCSFEDPVPKEAL